MLAFFHPLAVNLSRKLVSYLGLYQKPRMPFSKSSIAFAFIIKCTYFCVLLLAPILLVPTLELAALDQALFPLNYYYITMDCSSLICFILVSLSIFTLRCRIKVILREVVNVNCESTFRATFSKKLPVDLSLIDGLLCELNNSIT